MFGEYHAGCPNLQLIVGGFQGKTGVTVELPPCSPTSVYTPSCGRHFVYDRHFATHTRPSLSQEAAILGACTKLPYHLRPPVRPQFTFRRPGSHFPRPVLPSLSQGNQHGCHFVRHLGRSLTGLQAQHHSNRANLYSGDSPDRSEYISFESQYLLSFKSWLWCLHTWSHRGGQRLLCTAQGTSPSQAHAPHTLCCHSSCSWPATPHGCLHVRSVG